MISRSRGRPQLPPPAPPGDLGVDSPTRVARPPVCSTLRTSSSVDLAVPRRPMASKSALRRSIGQAGTTDLVASDGEPLAPLRSATSQHAPAALRGHAGEEPMLALAGALLGLIRPLHRSFAVL